MHYAKDKNMKKIQKSSELLWLLGIIFVAFGVAICSKTNLGVSMIAAPAFVIAEAMANISPLISVGVVEYLIQGIMLLILCVVVRKFNWRYLLAFAVAVLYGYTLNLFLWIMDGVVFGEVWLRWVMLIVGDFVTAFGVACFFRTYMPLQVYELFVAELSRCFRFDISKTKWAFDMSLLLISIVFAFLLFNDFSTFDFSKIASTSFHSIGLGTLVTTAINSPVIKLMGRLIDFVFDPSPRFSKLEKALSRK